jgi:hypothetical protein
MRWTLIVALLATGCATVQNGRYQQVPVNTDPAGAEVRVACGGTTATHVTPVVLRLPRGAEVCSLTLTKAGYRTEQVEFDTSASKRFWWNFVPVGIAVPISMSRGSDQAFVDFLVGGTATGIGFGLDALSDAMWVLHPTEVSLKLNPE